MAAETTQVQETLALDSDKQKEFEEKVKVLKKKVCMVKRSNVVS